MAQRRMFSPLITDSDAFLEMPSSAQNLYFHLGMRADDDGFVSNPKKILRMIGGADDDLKILIAKRFILLFESGVIVIKHWRINNYIRQDWYKKTIYEEEKNTLKIKANGAYSEKLVDENTPSRPRRLGKVRLGKVRIDKNTLPSATTLEATKEPTEVANTDIPLVIKAFEKINPSAKKFYGFIVQREACRILIEEYGLNAVLSMVENTLPKTNGMKYFPNIVTPSQLQYGWAKLENAIKKAEQPNNPGVYIAKDENGNRVNNYSKNTIIVK